ncbi:MAG: protein-L-isoaspartate(D-aspartate) O-methyltransferase [Gemmatimonadales bacterium]
MLRGAGHLPLIAVAAIAGSATAPAPAQVTADRFHARRLELVERYVAAQGVADTVTLRAMRTVPRHEFVPPRYLDEAYGDHPLPIGYGQTISQPYVVAYMTELLGPRPGLTVLEVGTGSGYQAAVLAEAGCRVRSIEIIGALADEARARLARLGYETVDVRHGDGHSGWPEAAPFDAIIVTAAAGYIPPALVAQLKPGGRMVIPVGSVYGVQYLILVEKGARGRVRTRQLLPVRFVPLVSGLR